MKPSIAKSLVQYSKQKFSGEFTANEMLLLRRPFFKSGNYEDIARLKFAGNVVCDTTTQLSLFKWC
jgi:hypothetical protein